MNSKFGNLTQHAPEICSSETTRSEPRLKTWVSAAAAKIGMQACVKNQGSSLLGYIMKMIQCLTLEEAKEIADGAEAKAIELGVKIAIAIMDEHGNLKYYRRMDGNNVVSVRMSQLKAMTSSSIPISTKALAERNATLENKPYLAVPGIVLLEGGLPIITKEGQHVGSIGVSGANPEVDGICAQAGLERIRDKLAFENRPESRR